MYPFQNVTMDWSKNYANGEASSARKKDLILDERSGAGPPPDQDARPAPLLPPPQAQRRSPAGPTGLVSVRPEPMPCGEGWGDRGALQ